MNDRGGTKAMALPSRQRPWQKIYPIIVVYLYVMLSLYFVLFYIRLVVQGNFNARNSNTKFQRTFNLDSEFLGVYNFNYNYIGLAYFDNIDCDFFFKNRTYIGFMGNCLNNI